MCLLVKVSGPGGSPLPLLLLPYHSTARYYQTALSHSTMKLCLSLSHPTQMPPSLSSTFPFTTTPALLLLFSTLLTTTTSSSPTFPHCTNTFTCGHLINLKYPFTGGDRPDYCGSPQFRLTCQNNNYAELTANSVTYRVLDVNPTQQTLLLARSDLWNTTCPEKFTNSTFDPAVFSYAAAAEDVTLVYGCSSLPNNTNYTPNNLFSCVVNGVDFSDAFYLVGPVPIDPILQILTKCYVTVTVPVNGEAAGRLTGNRTTLREVLMEGFSVNYTDPYANLCSSCRGIAGECGFDDRLGEPICICGDKECPIPAVTAGSGSSQSGIKIGLPIGGAIIAGIGLGWVIFSCRQRKKQREALAAQAESKELTSASLSKDVTTPRANFSRSIPSFTSSKSDFGKASTYFGVQVFSYTELEEATNNFDPSRELGDGGFGTVYYGVLQDGRVVAVKRLYENNFKRVEQFMNEVEILTRLRHENLVVLFGCTSKRSRELLLVYEYIPNGTVADHLHGKKSNSGLLSWPVRLNIAIETADALAYLHASDIIHRDVKTNNILLDNDFRVKVADFGLSKLFPNDVTHVSTAPQGTPGYVDPEYYQCYQLTEKSDVYSFGVVLIEIISSKQAVDTNRSRHDINLANMAIKKIQEHTLHELVDPSLGFETNNSVRRMITVVAELAFRCLQMEKDMRPSMEEVLKTLRGIKNEELDGQVDVVDIVVDDDARLLKEVPPPMSPDSAATEKWVSNSSAPNSSG